MHVSVYLLSKTESSQRGGDWVCHVLAQLMVGILWLGYKNNHKQKDKARLKGGRAGV
jgi:hypothetical protein